MKYLIEIANNLNLIKKAINTFGFRTSIDKLSSLSSSVGYIILDDKNMTVSYYNTVSEERTAKYIFIKDRNLQNQVIFIAVIAGKISWDWEDVSNSRRGYFPRNIKQPKEYLGAKNPVLNDSKKESFISGFNENNLYGRDLFITLGDVFFASAVKDHPIWNSKDMDMPYNFAHISVGLGEFYVDEDEDEPRDSSQDWESNREIEYFSFSFKTITNIIELFGCSIDELIDGLEEYNVINEFEKYLIDSNMSGDNFIDKYLDDPRIFGLTNGRISDFFYENGTMEYVLLKGSNKFAMFKMNTFLNCVDLPNRVFKNMVERSANDNYSVSDDYNSPKIRIDYTDPIRLIIDNPANLFRFKHSSFDILNNVKV